MPGGQLALQRVGGDAVAGDSDVGRLRHDAGEQSRQGQRFQQVAKSHPERHFKSGGIERKPLLRTCVKSCEVSLHGGHHRPRPGRGFEPVAAPDEQRIAQCIAQSPECVGHGRLGQMQCAGGGTDAAVDVDRLQHAEQVEVDAAFVAGHLAQYLAHAQD